MQADDSTTNFDEENFGVRCLMTVFYVVPKTRDYKPWMLNKPSREMYLPIR